MITPGARVTCAYRRSQEGVPHVGTALAMDDPEAWRGTVAFGHSTPSRRLVTLHVAWCKERGLLKTTQPVLWPWGVMWDSELSSAT